MSDEPRDLSAEIAVRLLDEPEFVAGMRAAALMLSATYPNVSEAEASEAVQMACSVIGRWMQSEMMPCEGGPQ